MENGFIRPIVDNSNDIDIIGGKHPVVSSIRPFTPNDCQMVDKKFWLISGPNMGGKV